MKRETFTLRQIEGEPFHIEGTVSPLAGQALHPPCPETHRTSTGACHLFMDLKSGWVG